MPRIRCWKYPSCVPNPPPQDEIRRLEAQRERLAAEADAEQARAEAAKAEAAKAEAREVVARWARGGRAVRVVGGSWVRGRGGGRGREGPSKNPPQL